MNKVEFDKKNYWLKKNFIKKVNKLSFENDLLLNLKIRFFFVKQNQNLFDKLVCLTVDLFDKAD